MHELSLYGSNWLQMILRQYYGLFRLLGYYLASGGLKPMFRDYLSVLSSGVKLSMVLEQCPKIMLSIMDAEYRIVCRQTGFIRTS
jgi:hypothetical protein